MFRWFFCGKPTCPVEPEQRVWIDSRVRWMIGEFGAETPRKVKVVLPTPEFFPGNYDGSREAGRMLFDQVGRYMGLDTRGMVVHFIHERSLQSADGWTSSRGAAGLYEEASFGTNIHLDESTLDDPLTLVAVAAHELSHVLLLGQGRLTGNETDHEQITDLLTIHLGLGIFTANTRVRDRSTRSGTLERWSIQQLGYLGQAQVGYALALWTRLRDDPHPAWAGYLCADVRAMFNQAGLWLDNTGHSILDKQIDSPCMLSDDELPPGFGKSM